MIILSPSFRKRFVLESDRFSSSMNSCASVLTLRSFSIVSSSSSTLVQVSFFMVQRPLTFMSIAMVDDYLTMAFGIVLLFL